MNSAPSTGCSFDGLVQKISFTYAQICFLHYLQIMFLLLGSFLAELVCWRDRPALDIDAVVGLLPLMRLPQQLRTQSSVSPKTQSTRLASRKYKDPPGLPHA